MEDETLEVVVAEIERCFAQPVATAVRIVRFHLNQAVAGLFYAMIVLEMPVVTIQEGLKEEAGEDQVLVEAQIAGTDQIVHNLMNNWKH